LFFQRRAQGEIGQGIRRSLYSFFVLHNRLFVPALFCQEPAESYAMASGTGIEGNRFLEILLRIGQRPLLHFEHRQIVVDLRRGSRFSGIAQRLPIIKFGFVEFLLLQVDGANLEKRGVGRVNLERARQMLQRCVDAPLVVICLASALSIRQFGPVTARACSETRMPSCQ